MHHLPLIVEPQALEPLLAEPGLLILDLSSAENYARGHIPGAVHLPPERLLRGQPPLPHKAPDSAQLSQLASDLGLSADTQVVAYDDQRGPWAGRLVWTLHLLGHARASWLDGQLAAWCAAGGTLQTETNQPRPRSRQVTRDERLIADKDWLLSRLGNGDLCIWDARSAAEFQGEKRGGVARGGHIPGACNLDWLQTQQGPDDSRLKPLPELRALLEDAGMDLRKEMVTHCQSHRRSGLTYIVARALGCEPLRCYDGSWLEWGNDPATPVET